MSTAPFADRHGASDWATVPAPHPALRIAVVVPVRNEAAGLGATLEALALQRDADGAPFDRDGFEILLSANNCSDGSAALARAHGMRWPGLALHVVEVELARAHAHVGEARGRLMDEACRRLLATAGSAGVIASTDGDTQVAPDWLASILAEVAAGADAVGGRIAIAPAPGEPAGLRELARRDETYQALRVRLEHLIDPDPADPWPRHHQHFGASLAVRAGAYVAVGGCPREPFLEDEALYRALVRHDLKVRHSDQVLVVTSGRRRGRVAVGLSQQRREWAAMAAAGIEPRVDDPTAWAATIELRRQLRALWASPALRARRGAAMHRLADLVVHRDIPPARLQQAWDGASTFGSLWVEIEGFLERQRRCDGGAAGHVEMRVAIATLRTLIARRQRLAARRDRDGTCRAAGP